MQYKLVRIEEQLSDLADITATLAQVRRKLQYQKHPDRPGEPWYRLADFNGTLSRVSEMIQHVSARLRRVYVEQ